MCIWALLGTLLGTVGTVLSRALCLTVKLALSVCGQGSKTKERHPDIAAQPTSLRLLSHPTPLDRQDHKSQAIPGRYLGSSFDPATGYDYPPEKPHQLDVSLSTDSASGVAQASNHPQEIIPGNRPTAKARLAILFSSTIRHPPPTIYLVFSCF